MKKSEVVVVSAFGRGHWLATDLARQGLSVSLLDLTESLGIWVPENVEGPFGIFQSEKIRESQWERILEDDPPMMLSQGLTLWLSDGPLELKGATTKHRLEKLGVDQEQQKFISQQSSSWQHDKALREQLNQKKMKESWLARIALLFSSSTHYLSAESIQNNQALPLFSSFYVRLATRQGHKRSLDWCRRNEVNVIAKAQVLDFAFQDRKKLKSIQFKTMDTEKTEQIEAEQFVWCLMSEETGMQGVRPQQALYPDGVLEPEWVWVRYRLRMNECTERQQLPLHCLIIPDLSMHWNHENFMVLQRTGSPDLFDLWIQIPNLQRFNGDYLSMRGQRIVDVFTEKMPTAKTEVSDYPLGLETTYKEAGPSRTPIFSKKDRQKLKPKKLDNIYYHSPEEADILGWESQFKLDLEIEKEIMIWWKKKQDMIAKELAKQQARGEMKSDR